MKNIEKYPLTDDAVKAWNEYTEGKGIYSCLDDWLKEEYVEPHEPTILEAGEAMLKLSTCGMSNAYKDRLRVLADAVDREKAKPIRNCDKYRTANDADAAFEKMCLTRLCKDCEFDKIRETKSRSCRISWLYAEADKEVRNEQ